MTNSVAVHRSSAYIHTFEKRQHGAWPRHRNDGIEDISKQARFVLRMAVACAAQKIPYELTWDVNGAARATITVHGPNIPNPKPFPKPPKERTVPAWKPSPFEAVYRLEAYTGPKGKQPGFVVEHSCGLSLVRYGTSESGEISERDNCDDIRADWSLTHMRSGQGLGFAPIPFQRAVKALLSISHLDWNIEIGHLSDWPDHYRASLQVLIDFNKSNWAKIKLAELEREKWRTEAIGS